IHLQFAHWETGKTGQVLAAICQRFSELLPRVMIDVTRRSFAEHFASLRREASSGKGPDVFLGSSAYLPDLIRTGLCLDLAPAMAREPVDLNAYWTSPGTNPTDGHQYAVPLWNTIDLVVYNRDHLAASHLAEPADSWTWDDLLAMAQKLTLGKPGEIRRWGLLLINDIQGGWGSFVASNGGDWVDVTRRTVVLDEAASLSALRWCVEAIQVHHVAPAPSVQQRLTAAGQLDPFLAGAVSLFPCGTWELPRILDGATFRWDVCRIPRAPATGRGTTISDVQPVSAARTTRFPDQCWEFLRFALGREAQLMLARDKTRLPARRDAADDRTSGYTAPPPSRTGAVVSSADQARDLGFLPGWLAMRRAIVRALDPAFDGQAPIEDAVRAAVVDGNAALAAAT
ncbi:MAG TPA: extracellular solute-binding protein, partial [Chloroflexota bacterium]|nr:extracellular solute-binding protein [Chloroflexota bacterium]